MEFKGKKVKKLLISGIGLDDAIIIIIYFLMLS